MRIAFASSASTRFSMRLSSSCYVHLRKPDSDIFQLALDIGQIDPEEVVYIDDRLMFVQVAQRLGMHCIEHTSYESTREKLMSLGLSLTQ